MGWRDTDWAAYEMAKRGIQRAAKSTRQKPSPSDARVLIQVPAEGLAPFLLDRDLLPKKPPGWKA